MLKPGTEAVVTAAVTLMLGWTGPAAAQEELIRSSVEAPAWVPATKPMNPAATKWVQTFDSPEARPWAMGTPPARQAEARALFYEGHALLKQQKLIEAEQKFRQSSQLWAHPAAHYNLAILQMELDRPLEVYQHLEAALRHGPAPLGQQKFELAQNYKALLEKQLVRLTINCDVPGAVVTLDGKALFTGPHRTEVMVRAGFHSVIATKDGFWPTDKSRAVQGGTSEVIDLKLYSEGQLTGYRTPLPTWVPLTVMGAGVALIAGGGLPHQQARYQFGIFDGAIKDCDTTGMGCLQSAPYLPLRDQGFALQNVAYGLYVAGGVSLATGLVLLLRNQPQAYRLNPEELEKTARVTPFITPGAAGATATFNF
ncbi:MAG TPA: hypothetical protein VK447_22075 [Myxococcaceae bacterium]|nr:hypothetical protein [Myxococcaceae bacterium]